MALSSRIRALLPPMLECSTIRSVRVVHGPLTRPSSIPADQVPAQFPEPDRTARAKTCMAPVLDVGAALTVGRVTEATVLAA